MNMPIRHHTVVVAAASRHGSATQIAERIVAVMAECLCEGWTARLGDTSDVRTFDDADAVVLGSAVYLGHWLRPALKVLRHVKDASLLDLWLFSTGPISDAVGEGTEIAAADEMVENGCATEHRVFPGRLVLSDLSLPERWMARLVKASAGDRRDWKAIDAWAASIASQLNHAVPAAGPPA